MRWLLALGVAAVVLAGAIVALPAAASAQAVNQTGSASGPSAFNDSQWVITVYENGSARWTHRYKQPLENETEVEQFRAYATRFADETTPLYTKFQTQATGLTEAGANATGRPMSARGFSRSATVSSQPGSTGVVEMSFLWTNFSATTDSGIAVGDVFKGGIQIRSGASIVFEAGPDLSIAWDSIKPAPDASVNGSTGGNDSATWFGERQFATGQPRVVFVEQSSGIDGSSALGDSVVWLAAALAVAVVLGAVVVRRSDGSQSSESEAATTEERTAETTSAETVETADEPPATVTKSDVSAAELRSDEEVVRSLLGENDGRMRQSEIVDETGWSKSKVSMLLSEMAEAGELSKLRVGRENIVSLDGYEPEAAGSPFDEE